MKAVGWYGDRLMCRDGNEGRLYLKKKITWLDCLRHRNLPQLKENKS